MNCTCEPLGLVPRVAVWLGPLGLGGVLAAAAAAHVALSVLENVLVVQALLLLQQHSVVVQVLQVCDRFLGAAVEVALLWLYFWLGHMRRARRRLRSNVVI